MTVSQEYVSRTYAHVPHIYDLGSSIQSFWSTHTPCASLLSLGRCTKDKEAMIFPVPTCWLWQHGLCWCFVWAIKKAFPSLPTPKASKLLFLLSFFFFLVRIFENTSAIPNCTTVFWFVFFFKLSINSAN